jgi:N-acetylated-alpha-linked acidic dipeptidase
MKSSLLLLAVIGAEACQRERVFKRHAHGHIKRQAVNATFPPVLDANEQILINSFDNTSISTWSYYYTHGDHIAGRNESMAQWTADKWAEYGFTSRLDEYCKFLHLFYTHVKLQSLVLVRMYRPLHSDCPEK